MKTFFKLIILTILLYFGYNYYCRNMASKKSNNELVSTFLSSSNYYLSSSKNIDVISMVSHIDMHNPEMMLYRPAVSNNTDFYYFTNKNTPRVYIYNTHPAEKYADNSYSVVDAALLLKEKLNDYGIVTLVEERNANAYLKEHNIPYESGYIATRVFLNEALSEYGDFDLIIDLHRDSVAGNVSVRTNIDNRSYAKVMFVMHKNYDNYQFAKDINNTLISYYPGISRGIYDERPSSYNQDVNSKVVLIEVGATTNTKEEVNNSISALAYTIKEILNEN